MSAAICFLYVAAILHGVAGVAFVTAASIVQATREIPAARFGMLFLPFLVSAAGVSSLGPRLIARFGRGGTMALGLVTGALALGLVPLAARFGADAAFAALLVCSAALGGGFSASGLVLNAGVLDGVSLERRARVLAGLHGVLAVGAAAAPLLLARMGENTWALALYGIAASVVLLAGVSALRRRAWFRPAVHAPTSQPLEAPAPRIDRRTAEGGGVWSVAAFLYGLSEATFANWTIVFLHGERGLDLPLAARALSSFWGAMAIGRLTAAAWPGSESARGRVTVHASAIAVAFALLAFAPFASTVVPVYLFAGLACSATFPYILAAAMRGDAGGAASAVGRSVALGLLTGSFGIGPFVEQFGMRAVLAASIVGPLVLALLAWRGGLASAARADAGYSSSP